MSLLFKNREEKTVLYNGISLDKLVFNDEEIWNRAILDSSTLPEGATWENYILGVSGNQQNESSAGYSDAAVWCTAGGSYGQSTWRTLIGYLNGLPIVGNGQTVEVTVTITKDSSTKTGHQFYLGYCDGTSTGSASNIPSNVSKISGSGTYQIAMPSDGKNYYIAAGVFCQSYNDGGTGGATKATGRITINSII